MAKEFYHPSPMPSTLPQKTGVHRCWRRFRHLQFQAPPKNQVSAPSAILQTKTLVVIPLSAT